RCAASVSSRVWPPLAVEISASASGSDAVIGAPPMLSATIRTARCATGLSRNARRTAPRYSNGAGSSANDHGETNDRAKGTRDRPPPLKAEARLERKDMESSLALELTGGRARFSEGEMASSPP